MAPPLVVKKVAAGFVVETELNSISSCSRLDMPCALSVDVHDTAQPCTQEKILSHALQPLEQSEDEGDEVLGSGVPDMQHIDS